MSASVPSKNFQRQTPPATKTRFMVEIMESEVTRPHPRTLTSLAAVLTSLSAIESQESALGVTLANLLADQDPIVAALKRLQSLTPHIDELQVDASLLSQKVGTTAQTAQRVGGRVRVLDEEMNRVREASDRVNAVMELKTSLADLKSSVDAEDWEAATRHCARAMSIPENIINGSFAQSAVPTSDLPQPPDQTLAEARQNLLEIFREQFAQASKARDSANTSRFFKLFPAIGWEKEGLEAYSDFVVDLVRGRSSISGKTSSPLYYITTLTSLFESIALIVDQHQPVVEKYYGPGKMLPVVARLLQECDRVVKGLIESWEEERSIQRKMQETSQPWFPSLAPSSQRRPANLPAEEDGPDPREIDKVLSEMAGMAGRWTLFKRFLAERLRDEKPTPPATPYDGLQQRGESQNQGSTDAEVLETPAGEPRPELVLIESSGCRSMFGELLKKYYSQLEIWYLRSIIDKAHRLSSQESTEPPQTTTPDDAFYILKLVLQRLLSTGSIDCVQRMSPNIRQVIERDLAGVMRRKMEEIYSNPQQGNRGVVGGTAAREKAEREIRNSFVVFLNDIDISSSHMDTLIKTILQTTQISDNFLEVDVQDAQDAISSLSSLVPKFHSIVKWGVEQLFNQLTRPKFRTMISDVYKDVSYVLDEDGYSAAEYQDVVRKRFIKSWESLVDGFKDTFTEGNYRAFFTLAIEVLVRPWEKHVLNMKFSELGAIRFDKDLRAITTYLSSQTAFGDAREKFQRLQQISTLLNLDLEEDPEEFYNGSGIVWKLSAEEARVAVALRVS